MSNLTGHSIGRYHIIEQLGEGGMATVYKAFDTRLERDVAVKIIRVGQFGQDVIEHILKRFEREAKALARLTHPNIVHVNDFGEHEGVPYLVMDYLPGGTLKERMSLPMTWQAAARLLIPVASALEYAHEHKIIHRDVKPANILLTEKGQPMLTDFGIARILETEAGQTLTGTGVGIGTPEYMAPEQGMGRPVDGRVDIYSLGIVFYELVSAHKPYTADTPMAVVFKHISDPLPDPRQFMPDLPESVARILFKALAKQPEDRYERMGAMSAALEALLAGPAGPQKAPQPVPVVLEATAPLPPPLPALSPVPAVMEEKVVSEVNTSLGQEKTVINEEETIDVLEVAVPVSAPLPLPTSARSQDVSGPKWAQPVAQKRSIAPWIGLGVVGIAVVSVLVLLAGFLISRLVSPPPTPTTASSEVVTAAQLATQTPKLTATATATSTPVATATPALGIGSTLTREKDGMVMVYVPEGPFTMGSNDSGDSEKPVHQVTLDAFWIDQTEVTNGKYVQCVQAGACQPPSITRSSSRPSYYGTAQYVNYPVIYIDWLNSKAYCKWAESRLPTEAEWEKAARGTDGRTYPWGEGIDKSYANYNSDVGDTTRVGSYESGKSPYGVYDMAGNVWEWVADWYGSYTASSANNPTGPASGESRVLRGGSWNSNVLNVRSADRFWYYPSNTDNDLGFRCSRSQ